MTFYRISMTNEMYNLFSIIVICFSNKKRRYFLSGGFDTDKDAKQVVY